MKKSCIPRTPKADQPTVRLPVKVAERNVKNNNSIMLGSCLFFCIFSQGWFEVLRLIFTKIPSTSLNFVYG